MCTSSARVLCCVRLSLLTASLLLALVGVLFQEAERGDAQRRFMTDVVSVVIATVAFGMGVDKRNVRAVVHWNLPKSVEGWVLPDIV